MLAKYPRFFPSHLNQKFVPALLETNPTAIHLQSIYMHQFNQQLFDGTLHASVFGNYLHDDYIYLQHYAKILLEISRRIIDSKPVLAKHLEHLATEIVAGETSMQEQYAQYFTHSSESKPGKTITNYIAFLTNHAEHSELPVALCCVLPCFWIYYQLGSRELNPQQLSNNPYKEWIATYSSRDFIEATHSLADTINELAEQSQPTVQAKMQHGFAQAVGFELEFFNEIYPENQLSCMF